MSWGGHERWIYFLMIYLRCIRELLSNKRMYLRGCCSLSLQSSGSAPMALWHKLQSGVGCEKWGIELNVSRMTEFCNCNFVHGARANSTVPPVAILCRVHRSQTRMRDRYEANSTWLPLSALQHGTDLVPVLSVTAAFWCGSKQGQHAVPETFFVATYLPGSRDNCIREPPHQRQQRLCTLL